ncbi:hypothetical protein K438DRAFT_1777407 [Mycena galopus ATCC 62051]|nr:hypothetical protein K438DRAFT_1777407 [Mycena galopus ATCC 62051]
MYFTVHFLDGRAISLLRGDPRKFGRRMIREKGFLGLSKRRIETQSRAHEFRVNEWIVVVVRGKEASTLNTGMSADTYRENRCPAQRWLWVPNPCQIQSQAQSEYPGAVEIAVASGLIRNGE